MLEAENEANKNPNQLRDEIVNSFEEFDVHFRKHHPVSWAATLFGPVLVTVLILVLIWIIVGWEKVVTFIVAELITFFILGRFVIIFGGDSDSGYDEIAHLTSFELFSMVTYLDLLVAFTFIFHMGFLFRLPYIGEKVGSLVVDGKFILDKQPWMKRVAFFGLVAFVVFPTSTTGSIGGSIFGRLLGLTRMNTFFAIALGSVIGNGLMLALAEQIRRYVDLNNVWYKVIGALIVVCVIVLIEWRYRAIKKKYMTENDAAENDAPGNQAAENEGE